LALKSRVQPRARYFIRILQRSAQRFASIENCRLLAILFRDLPIVFSGDGLGVTQPQAQTLHSGHSRDANSVALVARGFGESVSHGSTWALGMI